MPKQACPIKIEQIIGKNGWCLRIGAARLDARGRIPLGKLHPAEEVSFYRVYENSAGQIVLDPQLTIPAREAWLYKNKKALAMVKAGLKAVQEGRLVKARPEHFGEEHDA